MAASPGLLMNRHTAALTLTKNYQLACRKPRKTAALSMGGTQ
jgi:hypothetical protein